MKIGRKKADVIVLIGKQSKTYSLTTPTKRIPLHDTSVEEVYKIIMDTLKKKINGG